MRADLIGLACDIADPAVFQIAVLEGLARKVGFDAAFLASRTTGHVHAVGLDPAAVRSAVVSGVHHEELAPVKRAAKAAGGLAVDTEVLGERLVRQTTYHRRFAAPVGGRHGLMAYPTLRGQVGGVLLLGRAGRTFSSAEIDLVRSVLPALALADASYGAAAGEPEPAQGLPDPRRFWQRFTHPGGELERVDTTGGEVVVRDRRGFREMAARSNGAEMVWTSADIANPSRSGFPYVDLFHLAAALSARRERALFVGCGGAVAPRQFGRSYPGIRVDVVEREPAVVDLARRWFSLDAIPRLTVHIAEGTSFLARAQRRRWDVIVVDAYSAEDLATGMSSSGFFRHVARALAPGGAAAFNVIDSLDGLLLKNVLARVRSRFADVRIVPVCEPGERYDAGARRNVVLVMRAPAIG